MENVPVKIAENYKPPPRIYQLPQVVGSKLQLPSGYYYENPQFQYDFQLERKVVAKIPEWRRMRQQDRERRRERKQKREQQLVRAVEAQNRQLLGAVNYPSTEDLSSTESEDELENEPKSGNTEVHEYNVLSIAASSNEKVEKPLTNFHNILQPTILSPAHNTNEVIRATQSNTMHAGNLLNSAAVGKPLNGFNYKDFEEDTSSPFDNIELKTINDLDILRQVLNQTQLKPIDHGQVIENNEQPKQAKDTKFEDQMCNDNNIAKNNSDYKNVGPQSLTKINAAQECTSRAGLCTDESQVQGAAASLDVIANAKAELEKINFSELNQELQTNDSIPNINSYSDNYRHLKTGVYVSSLTSTPQHQQQNPCMPYCTIYNGFEQHPQQFYTNYNFQNAIVAGVKSTTEPDVYSTNVMSTETANSDFMVHSAKNYMYTNPNAYAKQYPSPQYFNTNNIQNHGTPVHSNEKTELNLKSKSVPDILKELSDEVHNSEMRRRSRNLSHTLDKDKHNVNDEEMEKKNNARDIDKVTKSYDNLDPSAQNLAQNISSMGFPLELVAKIIQRVGVDDKKVIEHLIPLSELMDLGFDESKISEALIKFDNNKERAIEYLIS